MFKYDFIQAKLHGLHSKSIVGENLKKYQKINSIDRLSKELFPQDEPLPINDALYSKLEKKYKKKILNQINYIAKYFHYKNTFINNLVLRYEIDNVKIILNAYFARQNKITELFEINIINTLNYQQIYTGDLSNINFIKSVLQGTVFDFIVPHLEEEKNSFQLENILDKFYYQFLIDSLKHLTLYEQKKMKPIIIEDMNWQNIIWALRMKIYYRKSFKNVRESFLSMPLLIPVDDLENIFDLTFVAEENSELLKIFPARYYDRLISYFNEEGDFDLIKFEQYISSYIVHLYTKNFYLENFNLLPIIAFIFIKYQEYQNVIHLVESIRYQ